MLTKLSDLKPRPSLAEREIEGIEQGIARTLAESKETYREWLTKNFPDIATHPLAERHKRLWNWFASLTPSPLWFVRGERAGGEGNPDPVTRHPQSSQSSDPSHKSPFASFAPFAPFAVNPNPPRTPNTEHRRPPLLASLAPLAVNPNPPTANSQPPTREAQPAREAPALNVYRITAGQPTWPGQSIETCERQINDWGLRAFLREAQHEVQAAGGYFFDSTKFEVVDDAPNLQRVCLAWDLAATEGGGDHTASVLMGKSNSGVLYVLHVQRVQHSSERVRELILKWCGRVRDRFQNYTLRFPQDPGQAGKAQAEQLRRMLATFRNVRVEPVTGAKPVRARGYAEMVNLGNVKLLRAPWNAQFIEEHRKFKEDLSHEYDDQVDAASDAFNDLATPIGVTVTQRVSPNPIYTTHQFVGSRHWIKDDEEDDDGEE